MSSVSVATPQFGPNPWYSNQPKNGNAYLINLGVLADDGKQFIVQVSSVGTLSQDALNKCTTDVTARIFTAITNLFTPRPRDFTLKFFRTKTNKAMCLLNNKENPPFFGVARDLLDAYGDVQFSIKTHVPAKGESTYWRGTTTENSPEILDILHRFEAKTDPQEGIPEDVSDDSDEDTSTMNDETPAPEMNEPPASPMIMQDSAQIKEEAVHETHQSHLLKVAEHLKTGKAPVVVIVLNDNDKSKKLKESIARFTTHAPEVKHIHQIYGIPVERPRTDVHVVHFVLYDMIQHKPRRECFPRTFIVHPTFVNEIPGDGDMYWSNVAQMCQ